MRYKLIFGGTLWNRHRTALRTVYSSAHYAGWNPAPAISIAALQDVSFLRARLTWTPAGVVRHGFTKLRALGVLKRPRSSPRRRPMRPV